MTEKNVIRALYDDKNIFVYQAFNKAIASSACSAQTFVAPPFKLDRMTWIKPSFLWMMYRSGWASKENQERILQVKITRTGFQWALENSCLSHFDAKLYQSEESWRAVLHEAPVRVQWDPEKDLLLRALPGKSIQIGLTGIAAKKYISEWIVNIEDITEQCKYIESIIKGGDIDMAKKLIPAEQAYPLQINLAKQINAI
jgi:hypothetical protein